MNPRDVPIPALMKHLPLDKRGYPILPMVVKDESGPKFAINDALTTARFMHEERCGICGQKLHRARWLVGGPGSAFLEHGAYLDPSMHTECLHYAMQVCPYLAAPRWSGPMGRKQAERIKIPNGTLAVIGGDGTDKLFPDRPDIFVAVQFLGRPKFKADPGGGLPVSVPPRPYRQVEYWIGGEQLSSAEGEAICAPILEAMRTKVTEAHG